MEFCRKFKSEVENNIIPEEFLTFIKNLFKKVKYECLVEGNIFFRDAENMITKVESGINKTFQDIEQYLGMCKFTDCTHTNEPGCRILKAIEDGELERERFEQYLKLQKESQYNTDSEKYLRNKKEKFKEIAKINRNNFKK